MLNLKTLSCRLMGHVILGSSLKLSSQMQRHSSFLQASDSAAQLSTWTLGLGQDSYHPMEIISQINKCIITDSMRYQHIPVSSEIKKRKNQ